MEKDITYGLRAIDEGSPQHRILVECHAGMDAYIGRIAVEQTFSQAARMCMRQNGAAQPASAVSERQRDWTRRGIMLRTASPR